MVVFFRKIEFQISCRVIFAYGVILAAICLHIAFSTSAYAQHPFQVMVKANGSGDAARTQQTYTLLPYKDRDWTVCVSLPHIKDSYWLAVNYGVTDQAKHLGINMRLSHAGGYDNIELQKQQILECVAHGGNAVVAASVTRDGLNSLVETLAKRGIPTVDLVNGISSPAVAAHATVDYGEMGRNVAVYITRNLTHAQSPAKLAWLPGPYLAGWVQDGNKGFRETLPQQAAQIVTSGYGDTGRQEQRRLLLDILKNQSNLNFIVGNAVAAEVAVPLLRNEYPNQNIQILSYYLTAGVYRGIKRGQILAAPTDSPVLQGRIAIDQAIRILEKQPYGYHVSPVIHMIDERNLDTYPRSHSLAPSGFRPTFVVHGAGP
jgi:protein TorT